MATNYIRYIIIVFICITSFLNSYSQLNNGGIPYGYSKDFELSNNAIVNDTLKMMGKSTIFLADSVINKVLEDINMKNSKNRYFCYGKNIPVNISYFNNAIKIKDDANSEVWVLRIESTNAYGYQVIFSDFYLPKGCKLYIYNEEHTMKLGAFTSRNNRPDNRFVTQNINGKNIIIELEIPTNLKENVILDLDKVVYIYRDAFLNKETEDDESCFRYTACSEAIVWETQIKSVALLLITDGDNWNTCTGTLLNKESDYMCTDKPFMISAAHCTNKIEDSGEEIKLEDCVAIFRYESDECMYDSNQGFENQTKSVVGFTEIEKDMEVDFLMLQLQSCVGEIQHYDIAFSGWDRRNSSDAITTNVVGIHHPMGKSKNISIAYSYPLSSIFPICNSTQTHFQSHLKLFFDYGNAHNGSSGSPLYNSSKKIIGALTGTDCNFPNPSPCDYKSVFYGKFSEAWARCDLSEYLAFTSDTEFVNDFTPIGADMDISYELPVEITTYPPNISSHDPFFVVRASATTSVIPPIRWYLWINKNQGDMNNYNYGSSMCYSFEQHTGLDGEFESDYFTQFNDPGTYKATLLVYDGQGKQSTSNFSIIISESYDPCIFSNISNDKTAKQMVFPKGANICLYDYCYVWDNHTYDLAVCNEIKLLGGEFFLPKYQGISMIKWTLNDNENFPEFSRTFNTTEYYQYEYGAPTYNPRYYIPFQNPLYVTLMQVGYNTIKLKTYGGKMKISDDATQFIHPFPFPLYSHHGPSISTKSFYVVDCESVWNIKETSQLFANSGSRHGLGIVLVNPEPSLIVNSGESVNWTTYNKIVINPGFRVVNGGTFVAIAKRCPEYPECDNYSTRITDNDKFKGKQRLNNISIYPNPAIDKINISGAKDCTFEIFDSQGRKIKTGIILNDEDIVLLKNSISGIYLIKFTNNFNQTIITQKIIIHE